MGDEAKRAAGWAAAELVEDGMRLGLGTGSTVAHFLDALAAAGRDVAGVPTSEETGRRCRELGIRLLDVDTTTALDLCVDGADELTPNLALTKGGGGALLREKVVATMADRMVVIATPDKVVDRLGDTFPLPVEVVPFAVGSVCRALNELGFEAEVRGGGDYRTDNGNAIVDARMPGGLDEPDVMEWMLALVPGVAESGLFIGMADWAILGHDDGRLTVLEASTEEDERLIDLSE